MSNSPRKGVEAVDEGSLEGVRIVSNRDGRLPKGILLPLAVMMVAGAALGIRAAVHDWRGLAQETQARLGSLFKSKPKDANPRLAEKARPTPLAVATADPPAPPKAKEAAKAPAEAAKPQAAWDEIHREAEKKAAEQAEAEKLKAEAEEKLAKTPLPPPKFGPRGRVNPNNPAAIARMLQQQDQMMREAHAQLDAMRREHDRMFGQMFQEHRRQQERFFNQMPPGMPNLPDPFGAPPPDFFGRRRQGMPFIEEKSGETEKDGVRTTWRTRVIVIGPDGLAER